MSDFTLTINEKPYHSLRFFNPWHGGFSTAPMHGLMHLIDDVRTRARNKKIWLEVGSFFGESAAIMLGHRFIEKLYCVDCRIYDYLKLRLANDIKTNRCEIHELLSAQASEVLGNIDVVYIDAEHTYDSVKSDIAKWYPKISSGGALCGHDYSPSIWPGVVQAVDEFCAANDYTITRYIDGSWMIIKR